MPTDEFQPSSPFMNTNTNLSLLLSGALLISCGLVGCLPYKVNTVDFHQTSSTCSGMLPKIGIDTNVSITGPFGGFIRSKKPYAIAVDHTDMSFSIAAVEFTKVVVTYQDGTTDPGVAKLKLPQRFASRHHVSINSGGPPPTYTFETPMRLITARVPKVISRNEPFTLVMEGRFIKDSGQTIPFKIKKSFAPQFENSVQSWDEVISGV
jgi:hypothetical protein